MKTKLIQLFKTKSNGRAKMYELNKAAFGKQLQPAPSFWLLVPVRVEENFDKRIKKY